MGWVANIAGIVIALFFVYNWFNKDKAPTTTQKVAEGSREIQSPTVTVKVSERRDSRLVKQPALQVQPPTIIPPPAIEQTFVNGASERATTHRPTPGLSVLSMMPPPPPPPTISSAPNAMPPPPRPSSPPRLRPPTVGSAPRPGGSSLRPPPSAASSLRVPPTKVLSNASMAPSSLMPPPKKASRQVVLEPGHSPLDWAALTANPSSNLRGKDAPATLVRVTPSQLKAQNGRKGRDAWTVYQGKVYNVTPYLPFHPGGKGELLRGAGKDSAKLFMEVHPWVNWDGMLAECCVGILVGEDEMNGEVGNKLDEMD